MRLSMIVLIGLSMVACQKKPDSPAPVAASASSSSQSSQPPPPPVTNCTGATVVYNNPPGETINDNSTKDFIVPGFEVSCGDTLTVMIRNPQGSPWQTLHDVNNGATYYTVTNQTVTLHSTSGIVLEVAIQAVLK